MISKLRGQSVASREHCVASQTDLCVRFRVRNRSEFASMTYTNTANLKRTQVVVSFLRALLLSGCYN